MKAELKKRFQCRDCDMPYCDIPCDDLTDEAIDWIMKLTNQRVIEELENIEESMLSCSGNEEHFDVVEDRIKQLKQD